MIEKIRKYNEKKKEISEKIWFQILNQILNIILALGTVLPMLYYICNTIPFCFEVNDDSVLQQILDGSYTGLPDAHAIFIKYPLSWIISMLYKKNPAIDIDMLSLHLTNVNWYVGSIVALTGFALVVVLYRLLNSMRCNRFLICLLYDLGFMAIWLPCFSKLTFSTAAAFFACMALLYLGLESKEEAWRPWNLLVLGILMMVAYCLRHSCFYMVIPLIIIEFLIKYHIHLFKSVKPWVFVCAITLLCGAIFYANEHAYSSPEWKEYFIYNHARAYMQDYEGFPEYEANQQFYSAAGISEEQLKTMENYSYCMVDGFRKEWINQTYRYKKSQEMNQTWKEKIDSSWMKALKFATEKKQAPYKMRFYSFYLWMVLLTLIPITLILRCKDGFATHILHLLESLAFAGIIAAEWIYLAIKDRFPQRVEECIRLMMITAALLLICHFLKSYQKVWMCRFHGVLQILIILLIFQPISGQVIKNVESLRDKQEYQKILLAEKGEVLKYCGKHPENIYVLDTMSFTRGSLPFDETKQMNWIMSGSWVAYSPLYEEKLKLWDTDSIGSEFLLRENVYIITRGKKKIEKLMGRPGKSVDYKIVDEFCSAENSFFEIYKVTGVD